MQTSRDWSAGLCTPRLHAEHGRAQVDVELVADVGHAPAVAARKVQWELLACAPRRRAASGLTKLFAARVPLAADAPF